MRSRILHISATLCCLCLIALTSTTVNGATPPPYPYHGPFACNGVCSSSLLYCTNLCQKEGLNSDCSQACQDGNQQCQMSCGCIIGKNAISADAAAATTTTTTINTVPDCISLKNPFFCGGCQADGGVCGVEGDCQTCSPPGQIKKVVSVQPTPTPTSASSSIRHRIHSAKKQKNRRRSHGAASARFPNPWLCASSCEAKGGVCQYPYCIFPPSSPSSTGPASSASSSSFRTEVKKANNDDQCVQDCITHVRPVLLVVRLVAHNFQVVRVHVPMDQIHAQINRHSVLQRVRSN